MSETQGLVSNRGAQDANTTDIVFEVMENVWNSESNPRGYVNLGIAENALMHQELLEYINANFRLSPHGLTYGDGNAGSQELRNTIATFLTRYFNPLHPVIAEQLVMMNGCTTAIEAVAYVFANPGDGILLGQPFYTAFPRDMGSRAHAETIQVRFGDIDPFSIEAPKMYEEALLAAESSGTKVRALMLCSPHNPLGGCYPKETLVELMKFCQKYKIHLISDEIYALSVFHNQDVNRTGLFTSVLSIDLTGIIDPQLVHVMWGMSKDFGANGLRVACVVSQNNKVVIQSLMSPDGSLVVEYANMVRLMRRPSAPSDVITHQVLANFKFVDFYIKENQSRISEHHRHVILKLQKHRIPYYKHTTAAFFIWVDLLTPYTRERRKPQSHSATLESSLGNLNVVEPDASALSKEITVKLLAERVFCAAGENFGGERPGWFRIVFTQPKAILDEGFVRIVRALDLN